MFKRLTKSRRCATISARTQNLGWTQSESSTLKIIMVAVRNSSFEYNLIIGILSSEGGFPVMWGPLISETRPLEESASHHCALSWSCIMNLAFMILWYMCMRVYRDATLQKYYIGRSIPTYNVYRCVLSSQALSNRKWISAYQHMNIWTYTDTNVSTYVHICRSEH